MWNFYHEERESSYCKGIKLPNSEVMKEFEKEGYSYLGIVELHKIKENEMKEKTMKKYQ